MSCFKLLQIMTTLFPTEIRSMTQINVRIGSAAHVVRISYPVVALGACWCRMRANQRS